MPFTINMVNFIVCLLLMTSSRCIICVAVGEKCDTNQFLEEGAIEFKITDETRNDR